MPLQIRPPREGETIIISALSAECWVLSAELNSSFSLSPSSLCWVLSLKSYVRASMSR
jgi:hypothetical protein